MDQFLLGDLTAEELAQEVRQTYAQKRMGV
jgi:hypothetical protein